MKTRRFAPLALMTLCFLVTVLAPCTGAAQSSTDVTPVTPVSDGTGGPSTLTLFGAIAPDARNVAESMVAPNAQTMVDPSTGAAESTFAFQLPKARGGAQPFLSLSYNSSDHTVGFAGAGWTLQMPSIIRQGANAMPRFTDDVFTASPAALAAATATFDSYMIDGVALVPICAIGSCTSAQLAPTEVLPTALAGTSLAGWMYFRREVDDGARYFFSPAGQTWVRQEKSGVVMQFGSPLDIGQVDPSLSAGIERPAATTDFVSSVSPTTAVYRWNLVRESDASGNTVYYTWTTNASIAPGPVLSPTNYLSDIYDTLAVGSTPTPSAFAHHVHLTWQLAHAVPSAVTTTGLTGVEEPSFSSPQISSPIWHSVPFAQLSTVDVTSASWSSTARGLVRRYNLNYLTNSYGTLNRLSSITLEGECPGANGALSPIAEVNNVVPNPSGCKSPAILQLAQYTYYPDTLGGAPSLSEPTPAFDLPNPFVTIPDGQQVISGTATYLDVNGDGAADLITGANAPVTSFNVQSFGGAPSPLACPTDALGCQDLLPGFGYGNGEHPLMVGDWLGNGTVNWLTYESDSSVGLAQWTAYTASGGSLGGVAVNAGNCENELSAGCDTGRAFDLDGDGLLDMTIASGNTGSYFTTRTHDGTIAPFSLLSPSFGGWQELDFTNFSFDYVGFLQSCPNTTCPTGQTVTGPSQVWRSDADMDGDGLSDMVLGLVDQIDGLKLLTWTNQGDGTFNVNPIVSHLTFEAGSDSISEGWPGVCLNGSPGQYTYATCALSTEPYADLSFINGNSATGGGVGVHVADVNGDGLADIVTISPQTLAVCFGAPWQASVPNATSPAAWNCISTTLPLMQPAFAGASGSCNNAGWLDLARTIFTIADIDGTGIPRILFSRYVDPITAPSGLVLSPDCDDAVVYETTVLPGTSPSLGSAPSTGYPGLLQTVTLLGGEQQTLTYQPVTTLPSGTGSMPDSAWVTTSLQTTNGLPSSSPEALTSTTTYSYQTPVYDPRDKQFVGFQSEQESQTGASGAPGLVRKTSFATAACGSLTGTPCTGQVDYGWFRATRALPVVVNNADTTGANNSTTLNTYSEHEPYVGLDGRIVRQLPLFQQTTYQWDPANQAPASAAQSPFTNLGSSVYETYASGLSWAVSIPGTGAKHMQQVDRDNLGNQIDAIDFGQPGVDTPIRTNQQWSLAPGDTTGWSYRLAATTLGYTTDSTGSTIQSPPARSYTFSYTPLGQLLTQMAALPNEPAPMGSPTSTTPNFVAGAPPDATTADEVCLVGCTSGSVTGIQYDQYGNATTTPRANNRCTGIAYDPLFGQWPQTKLVYQAGCGSTSPVAMETVAIYDRGLERPTEQTAPFSGATPHLTTMSYDPFGRLAQVNQPMAQFAGAADIAFPAITVTYNDTGPLRKVSTFTADGTILSYQEHDKYIDGLGDVMVSVDEATTTGQGSPVQEQWIVSGAHTRYPNGLVARSYPPYFVTTFSTDSYVTTSPPASEVATASYDGAGRVVGKTDFKGNPTKYTYDFGPAVPAFPGIAGASASVTTQDAEQLVGSHPGSETVVYTDGHGRAIQSVQHLVSTISGGGNLVTTTSYAASGETLSIGQTFPTGAYARQMTYDALGRMVSQTEPNAGTCSYAYNDSGDLVGIADARGCGEVIYHDGMGRVIAEDYSTCTAAQTYTPPTLSNGNGTEAFYGYTPYGQLAQVYDRAQHSVYTYDGRGRITAIHMQIATPEGGSELATRYAPHTYAEGFLLYAESNRLLKTTTGTDLADLEVNGLSEVTTSYFLQGPIGSVTSSYGALVSSQTVDARGHVIGRTYGDVAQTAAQMTYDNDESLASYSLGRTPGPWANYTAQAPSTTSPPLTLQSNLADLVVGFDGVENPTLIFQEFQSGVKGVLVPSEWPSGAKPIDTRRLVYGDDYRLAEVFSTYELTSQSAGSDEYVSPYEPSDGAEYPTPHVPSTGFRPSEQTYEYDLRGNPLRTTDDASDFFDRSIGTTTLVADQIVAGGVTTGYGSFAASYDASGNLENLSIAGDSTYAYTWDEVGQLATATRTDPDGTQIEDTYAYDAKGHRIRVTGQSSVTGDTLHTIQVFDSLVLKNAVYPDANGDYEHDDSTEQLYLNAANGQNFGHAFIPQASIPSASSSNVHVFMPLRDPLGSTAFVIDHDTSELVEAATYQPYGAVDSDYRPSRWDAFREDIRYTSHWDNAEVGLVYMKARYYSPQLGRFISPDPKTIHGVAGDLNPYEYTAGSPLRFVDASGLQPCDTNYAPDGCVVSSSQTSSSSQTNQANILEIPQIPTAPPSLAPPDQMWPTFNENPWRYSPGLDTTLTEVTTPRQMQEDQLNAFATIGTVGMAATAELESQAANTLTNITAGDIEAAQGTVTVYHASINNGQEILANGLSSQEGATYVTRDIEAAQDVLLNHPDAVAGQGTIIQSDIPASQFSELMSPAERPYSGFYPYLLDSTEIPLSTPGQIQLFNQGIVGAVQ